MDFISKENKIHSMKIAIISMIRDSWGGSEELWYNMAKVALTKGHEVIHLSYQHRSEHLKFRELRSLGLVSYKRPGITDNDHSPLSRFISLSINFIRKKIQKPVEKFFMQKPDVVLYNGTCYSILSEKEVLRELKKFAGHFFLLGHFNERQSSLTEEEQIILKEVYKTCAGVFFTSYNDIEKAQKDLNLTISNAVVVRNPVNLKDKTILPFPENKPIQMAMVGNLVTVHKGQDITLNVLKNKIWETRSWHLNIYGSGPDENYLKKLCDENHLAGRASFHGQVNDIRALWQKNHILLMPSRMEGVPLAMVEAMLCGRPCVITNVGGISEWIEENRSGFIAESVTFDSFEKALERAWQYKDQWEEMGKYAHDRAIQLYDPNPGKTLLDMITE
jgi:glycosyltransferase involved in cell wall biosynthesis